VDVGKALWFIVRKTAFLKSLSGLDGPEDNRPKLRLKLRLENIALRLNQIRIQLQSMPETAAV